MPYRVPCPPFPVVKEKSAARSPGLFFRAFRKPLARGYLIYIFEVGVGYLLFEHSDVELFVAQRRVGVVKVFVGEPCHQVVDVGDGLFAETLHQPGYRLFRQFHVGIEGGDCDETCESLLHGLRGFRPRFVREVHSVPEVHQHITGLFLFSVQVGRYLRIRYGKFCCCGAFSRRERGGRTGFQGRPASACHAGCGGHRYYRCFSPHGSPVSVLGKDNRLAAALQERKRAKRRFRPLTSAPKRYLAVAVVSCSSRFIPVSTIYCCM